MFWRYVINTGKLYDPDFKLVGIGYSGSGLGLNNPLTISEPEIGPIPPGKYSIGDFFNDKFGKGPLVCCLNPEPFNIMYGRSGFMIHGDNHELNHTASHGCIILDRVRRQLIKDSSYKVLLVASQ